MPQYAEILMPPEQQEGTESVVGQWLKEEGQIVTEHEPLLEINTDKVVVEIPCPASGTLAECAVQPGEPVQPGQRLGRIQLDGAEAKLDSAARQPASVRQKRPSAAPKAEAERRLSPAVRRILQERKIDPSQIAGSGRGGRITHQDVLDFLAAAPPARVVPSQAGPGKSRTVPHTPMRRAIAQHMLDSIQQAPHVTAVFEADFSAVAADRSRRKESFEQRGVKLTYTAYLVAAAARALMLVPEVNSRWRDDALEIFEDCNIGVAVALEKRGLIVPVLRQAQNLSLFGIASSLQELTRIGQQGKLTSSHLEGGTFTITNHGTSGSLIATPIIHQPQAAILGVGKVEKRLKVVERNRGDSLEIRPMAYVTLTIDHRALDGYTANQFLQQFVQELEESPSDRTED